MLNGIRNFSVYAYLVANLKLSSGAADNQHFFCFFAFHGKCHFPADPVSFSMCARSICLSRKSCKKGIGDFFCLYYRDGQSGHKVRSTRIKQVRQLKLA